jgi:mannose-6-phosphate isomerase class I
MRPTPFSFSGNSFSVHEWRGSGPATLQVHHSDDEAWHVLDGELTFRYSDRTENVGPGTTVFVPAGMPHTYTAGAGARYRNPCLLIHYYGGRTFFLLPPNPCCR